MHLFIKAGTALFVTGLLLLPATAADVAGSIDYQFGDRPSDVSADFKPTPNAALRFLRINTLDRFAVDAALWEPVNVDPAKTPLVISVHGSGDNYSKPPISFLSPALAAKNYSVLAINTRQHDTLVNTDNFLHVRQDIEAAVYTARALGYRSIVMHGHSLGNIQVQFYVATAWAPDIKAVVLTGMFANLPWKSRHMLVQNETNFSALMGASHQALKEERTKEVMPVLMQWFTGQQVPMTAQHFLTYRSEASSTADGTYWIKRVPVPVILVRDAGDAVVAPFEPYMLMSAATAAGSLVPKIEYKLLPNTTPASLPNHYFTNNQQPLIDAVSEFLQRQTLSP
jgi:hypothetical protein